jgi:hypothetical protein
MPGLRSPYSADLAGFIKCLDKVVAVVVNSPMLARRLHHSPQRNSFPCILLPPLCAPFPSAALSFQSLAASFRKTPGWGVPLHCPSLESTTPSLFFCSQLQPLQLIQFWTTRSDIQTFNLQTRFLLALCFHILTNCFFRKPFVFTTIRIALGCRPPADRRGTHTLAKSFRVHSYENTRDGGATVAPVSASMSPCLPVGPGLGEPCGESVALDPR